MELDNDLMDKWLLVQLGADAAFCRELIEEIQDLRNQVEADDALREENASLTRENQSLIDQVNDLNARVADHDALETRHTDALNMMQAAAEELAARVRQIVLVAG